MRWNFGTQRHHIHSLDVLQTECELPIKFFFNQIKIIIYWYCFTKHIKRAILKINANRCICTLYFYNKKTRVPFTFKMFLVNYSKIVHLHDVVNIIFKRSDENMFQKRSSNYLRYLLKISARLAFRNFQFQSCCSMSIVQHNLRLLEHKRKDGSMNVGYFYFNNVLIQFVNRKYIYITCIYSKLVLK